MHTSDALHKPVMLQEAIDALNVSPNNWYIDATFGRGGHTRAILNNGGNVIAFDHDQEAVSYGQIHFVQELEKGNLVLKRANFSQMKSSLEKYSVDIQGILFDFGTSVDQLTDQNRGFSFTGNGPLDMRMDDRLGVTAAQLLAALNEQQLSRMFKEYGGEEAARAIAKSIVSERKNAPIETTQQLVALIARTKRKREKLHPATKVFQALRMVVNSEVDSMQEALPQALESIVSNGVIVTIAFHEGEDRVVKQQFKEWHDQKKGTAHPLIKPSISEIEDNPRSRSAKLRVFSKK